MAVAVRTRFPMVLYGKGGDALLRKFTYDNKAWGDCGPKGLTMDEALATAFQINDDVASVRVGPLLGVVKPVQATGCALSEAIATELNRNLFVIMDSVFVNLEGHE